MIRGKFPVPTGITNGAGGTFTIEGGTHLTAGGTIEAKSNKDLSTGTEARITFSSGAVVQCQFLELADGSLITETGQNTSATVTQWVRVDGGAAATSPGGLEIHDHAKMTIHRATPDPLWGEASLEVHSESQASADQLLVDGGATLETDVAWIGRTSIGGAILAPPYYAKAEILDPTGAGTKMIVHSLFGIGDGHPIVVGVAPPPWWPATRLWPLGHYQASTDFHIGAGADVTTTLGPLKPGWADVLGSWYHACRWPTRRSRSGRGLYPVRHRQWGNL